MPENVRAIRLRVGRNIQRLRLLRGFSQEQLAELVGNSDKHIGRVERGEVNVGLDILSRVARALSADVSDLFVVARRGASDPQVFLVTSRQLEQMDQTLRSIRSTRAKRSTRPAV